MKKFLVRLRGWWYRHIRRCHGEICKDCGRPVARGIGTWWDAPDGLWVEINDGPGGCLCPKCFADRCMEKEGLLIYWVPLIEARSLTQQIEDEKLAEESERLGEIFEAHLRPIRNRQDGSRLE